MGFFWDSEHGVTEIDMVITSGLGAPSPGARVPGRFMACFEAFGQLEKESQTM
jgi:hypothetical protein